MGVKITKTENESLQQGMMGRDKDKKKKTNPHLIRKPANHVLTSVEILAAFTAPPLQKSLCLLVRFIIRTRNISTLFRCLYFYLSFQINTTFRRKVSSELIADSLPRSKINVLYTTKTAEMNETDQKDVNKNRNT